MDKGKQGILLLAAVIFSLSALISLPFGQDTASAQDVFSTVVTQHKLIQVWEKGQAKLSDGAPYWVELLGGPEFQTDWIKVGWLGPDVHIQIKTNMPERGVDDGGNTGSTIGYNNGGGFWQPADLFVDLDQDGVYDVAIVLIDHGPIPADPSAFPDPPGYGKDADNFLKGNVYQITDWFNSDDIHRWHYEYGGRYDQSAPKVPPIWARHGKLIGSAIITWKADSGPGIDGQAATSYLVDIMMNGINLDGSWNQFCLYWGTGNCANNILTGCASGPRTTKQVPTLNQWGMILFALLALMLGTWMAARRRSV